MLHTEINGVDMLKGWKKSVSQTVLIYDPRGKMNVGRPTNR